MCKKLVSLIVVLIFSFVTLNAQDCYNYTREQGISFYNKGDYNAAKLRFIGAKECPDKPAGHDLDAWIRKCDSAIAEQKRKAEEEERRRKEEALRRENEQQFATKGYMDIVEVLFKNANGSETFNEYGQPLNAADVRYLYPRIKYNGLASTSKNITLSVKIINPDGSLKNGTSSPSGYSYSDDIIVSPGTDNYLYLSGYGTANGGSYSPGTYKFELWYDNKCIHRQNFTLQGPKEATYLKVDNKTAVSSSWDAGNGHKTYYVDTDGPSYEVVLLPNWCSVSDQTASYFTIAYNANSTANTRTDWFEVKSGSKRVRVNLSQAGSGPTAKIENITADYNVWWNNRKGMMIHVKFSVDKMKGKTGSVAAYFYNKNGLPLKDRNSSYRTGDGDVATHENFTPSYDSAIYNDFKIFMPLEELHITASGVTECYFSITVWDGQGSSAKSLCYSEKYYFTVTN